jgi:collagen type III alpha
LGDVTSTELQILSKAMGPVVLELIVKAVADVDRRWLEKVALLENRILELETRPPVVGPVGPIGERGEPGAPGESGARGVQGEKGIDGRPGEKGEPGMVGPIGLSGPKGEVGRDGKDGKDGRDGIDGKAGADGMHGRDVDMDHVKALILGELANWPRPHDGKDGRDGINGKDGIPGLNGKDGADGLNGKDGATGLNGKDGIDGLAFEDADITLDDDGWVLTLTGGNRTKAIRLPMLYDHGVWEAGKAYAPGAGVTWDGQYFIARTKSATMPSEGSDWRLAVRRGKQGKDGKPGPPGPEGGQGPQGPTGARGPKGDPVGV